jgi:outer membrane receptor protein involved in Fe transport
MRKLSTSLLALFAGTALNSLAFQAEAQQAPPSAAGDDLLGEVVVTATRQTDTVSRVPLSITAVTQKSLDQGGIKSVSDLSRTVPALTVSAVVGGVATLTIRGIAGAGPTQATTGAYLDDTPLQKRNSQGVSQNNGTPVPPLFDLDRVEVLRGPQGTLYGGSSEGGTIRFITPTPSLTRSSMYMRSEVSATHYGDPSYELGVAVGAPIVQDKLGFRIAVYGRHTGGYIDYLDPYLNGAKRFEDGNTQNDASIRASVLFAPTENSRITLAYFGSRQRQSDQTGSWTLPVSGTFTVPTTCFRLAPGSVYPAAGNPAAVACPAPGAPVPANTYIRPGVTYGPFPYLDKPYSYIGGYEKAPVRSTFDAPSLTLEYNFPKMTVKSITSYIHDESKGHSYEQPQVTQVQGVVGRTGVRYQPGSTLGFIAAGQDVATGFPLWAPFPDWAGDFRSLNKRHGITEELRFSSADTGSPLSWVFGLYYSKFDGHTNYILFEDLDRINPLAIGVKSNQRYTQRYPLATGQTCANLGLPAGTNFLNVAGACLVGLDPQLNGQLATAREQTLADTELASFGEANYFITSKLKLTAGLRLSRIQFDYRQVFYGAASGFLVPTLENTGITVGSSTESPVTPKFGAQYQFTETNMAYVTAAKGYRGGGVNVPLPVAICGPGLANIGLTVEDAPKTYDSDSVWSYEAGSKFRLFGNRLQVNTSAFRIDWKNVQLNVAIPGCGPTFVQNAGQARSQGFDLEAQARPISGVTLGLSLGYNDAQYTTTATGPIPKNGSPATPVVQKGDKLPVPPWAISVNARYDFSVLGKHTAYLRADWRYTSKYFRGFGPGVNSFAPDTRQAASASIVNARAGMNFNRLDINLFVNNLFESRDALGFSGGRTSCTPNTDASCATFTSYNPFFAEQSFRPREIGLQVAYRY